MNALKSQTLLRLFFMFALAFGLISSASLANAASDRKAQVMVWNFTGKTVANISLAHKYSDVYKDNLKHEEPVINLVPVTLGKVRFRTGIATTGQDWWVVGWTSLEDGKAHLSNPNNFRNIVDGLERFGQIHVPAVINSAAVLLTAACGPKKLACDIGAAYAGPAIGAAVAKMMNDESTVGFKKHVLRASDSVGEGGIVNIYLQPNGKIEIQSPSGKSTTVYKSEYVANSGQAKAVLNQMKPEYRSKFRR